MKALPVAGLVQLPGSWGLVEQSPKLWWTCQGGHDPGQLFWLKVKYETIPLVGKGGPRTILLPAVSCEEHSVIAKLRVSAILSARKAKGTHRCVSKTEKNNIQLPELSVLVESCFQTSAGPLAAVM